MSPLQRRIYDVVQRHPGWHAPRIAEAVGHSVKSVESTLRLMRERGYLRSATKLRPVLRRVRCYEVRNGGHNARD